MTLVSHLPPDFADNQRYLLSDVLNGAVERFGQRRMAVATGFFSPRVWQLLRASLPRLDDFRLLLGKEPDVEQGGSAALDLRAYFKYQLAGDLESMAFDRQWADLVDELLAFLHHDHVAIRLSQGAFLHAKAYIFPEYAVVGSSNFTPAGLTANSELNLVSTNRAVAGEILDWFEGKWQGGEDYKPELIATLEASKFGSQQYRPFDVFLKALHEYFKDRISPEAPSATVDLAAFQEEGRNEAIRLLDRHHSVLIADAVGLGKTYLGLSLLDHYVVGARKRSYRPRGLVICPAQLRESVWKPILESYGLAIPVLSQEELGREDFDLKRYGRYDVVLIDESHNFRNPATNRYRNLSRMLIGGRVNKKIVLMTATPINNSIWDLYHQFLLMTRGSDSYYRDFGIANLKGFFTRVDKGSAELFDLLEETTVRRSRQDIRRRQQEGEKIIVAGRDVHFPDRRLHALHYDLDASLPGWYGEIDNLIENLGLVSYNIEQYKRRGAEEHAVQFNRARISLIKTVLLKRLESSAAAFEVSIRRQAEFQRRFLTLLREGRLLDAARYRKLVSVEEDDERAEAVDSIIASLPPVEASEYNLEAMSRQVESDVGCLQGILDWLDLVRDPATVAGRRPLKQDDKLRALKQSLASDRLRGRKLLIFASFQDTAQYIDAMLRADRDWFTRAGSPQIGLITGSVPPAERQRLVRRFAPKANRTAEEQDDLSWQPPADQIQILISTDVLSEGQNLQDASVVLNYDLHWNPVRMIQRAGRIDRIGSEHDPVHIYNTFPDEGLNDLLGLVGRLTQRILTIDTAIGLDASVLGEVISEKSLAEIRRLKQNDQRLLDELEQESELASAEEMKFPLLKYIFEAGEDRIREIPLGVHSGRSAGPAGTFFAFRARDRHFWRFYPADGSATQTEVQRIYRHLACDPSEPRRMPPGYDVFPVLERAPEEILAQLRHERGARRIPPPMTGITRRLYDTLSAPGLFDRGDDEQRQRLIRVLRNASLRPFERDRTLRNLLKEYEQTKDASAFQSELEDFFAENDLLSAGDERRLVEEVHAEDLRLVCYEVLH
jgi:superfamily II DNA or RNA helicase